MYHYTFQDLRHYILLVVIIFTSCTSNLDDRVKLLEQAHNNHEIDKVISLYADDAKFILVGGWMAAGKDKLIERFNWDFAVNGSLKFYDYKTFNDTVICKVEERNDFFKMLNINVVEYDYSKFIFEDNLIKEVQAKLNQESKNLIEDSMSSFISWASSERLVEIDSLKSNGSFAFTREKSRKWLELLRAYKEKSNSGKNQYN